jgi:hypothetical protein
MLNGLWKNINAILQSRKLYVALKCNCEEEEPSRLRVNVG